MAIDWISPTASLSSTIISVIGERNKGCGQYRRAQPNCAVIRALLLQGSAAVGVTRYLVKDCFTSCS